MTGRKIFKKIGQFHFFEINSKTRSLSFFSKVKKLSGDKLNQTFEHLFLNRRRLHRCKSSAKAVQTNSMSSAKVVQAYSMNSATVVQTNQCYRNLQSYDLVSI